MRRKYWYRYIDTIMSDGKARTAANVRSNLWDFFSTRQSPGKAYSMRHFPSLREVGYYLSKSSNYHSIRQPHRGDKTARLWQWTDSSLAAETFHAPLTNEEGYELRPIGWRPGTGYRDEATPSSEIYRTFEEAVEWIREQERRKYQEELDALLSRAKILVTNIEYAGFITDEDLSVAGGDYFFEGRRRNLPSGYESPLSSVNQGLHEAYYFYPGHRYSPDEQAYVFEEIPPLPDEVLITIGGDDGSRWYGHSGDGEALVNYVELLNKGEEGRYVLPYSPNREPLTFEEWGDWRGRTGIGPAGDASVDDIIAFYESSFTKSIARKLLYRTGGVPIAFDWDLVDNYLFDEMNPQIVRAWSESDGHWLTELEHTRYRASDEWDCTEDMNVDTGSEYRQRMLYGGCAGNSATYFTYPSMGNYPYFVEPVVLEN